MNNGPFLPRDFQFNLNDQIDQASQFSREFDQAMESIDEANREKHEREEQNRENIQVTAKVLHGMFTAMQEEAANAAERDADAKASATRNFLLTLASTILAALAVITPFVIEAIKGWK